MSALSYFETSKAVILLKLRNIAEDLNIQINNFPATENVPSFTDLKISLRRSEPTVTSSYPHSKFHSKAKAIPLQAWTGPDGSRNIRHPDFKIIGT
jgi:hypothetical protein